MFRAAGGWCVSFVLLTLYGTIQLLEVFVAAAWYHRLFWPKTILAVACLITAGLILFRFRKSAVVKRLRHGMVDTHGGMTVGVEEVSDKHVRDVTGEPPDR